jgi:hypothetical protein
MPEWAITRRDPEAAEIVEALDEHLRENDGDIVRAWMTLRPEYLDLVDQEIERCTKDFLYYLGNYHIIRSDAQTLCTLWPLWDAQQIFLEALQDSFRKRGRAQLIVLKARQLGLSTISEAMVFYRTMFNMGMNTLIVAQDPGQADYLFEMSRLAYDNLPWWMRPESRYEQKGRYLVFDRRDETSRLINPGLRSQIFVEAANKMTGVAVGKTIGTAHLSEISLWPDAEILTEQIFPTLNAPDELAIMESTARGRKDFWHFLWEAAIEGRIPWTPVFIPFYRVRRYRRTIPENVEFRPTAEELSLREKVLEETGYWIDDEQLYWRREQMEMFRAVGREYKFYQEYPAATWREAFQSSAMCAFDRRKLQRMVEKYCRPPRWVGEIDLKDQKEPDVQLREHDPHLPPPEQKYRGGRLWVWEEPEEDATYYIGADVAYGIEGGDFSCAQVIKVGYGTAPDVQVAEWHGYISPTPFARVLAALGYWYNNAEISPECNDVGKTTAHELFRVLDYPNLYRWKHLDKIKNYFTDWYGWETNHKSRGFIINKMREAVDEGTIILRSELLIDQMMEFGAEEEGARFEGQGVHDDRVMAIMIAHFCAHEDQFSSGWKRTTKKTEVEKKGEYHNTDWSPIWDGRQIPEVGPVEQMEGRTAPEDVLLHQEANNYEEEAWKNF